MQKRSRTARGKIQQPTLAADAASKPRILVVDDDERNLLAIREVLAGTGDVVCAQSGEEALRFLLKDKFAVILLDVLMPGLDGYETAALIRSASSPRARRSSS